MNEDELINISSDIVAEISWVVEKATSEWLWSLWFEADPMDIIAIAGEVLNGS